LQAVRGLPGGWPAASATLADNPSVARTSIAFLMSDSFEGEDFPDNVLPRIEMTARM
jgi:hypothetical protein